MNLIVRFWNWVRGVTPEAPQQNCDSLHTQPGTVEHRGPVDLNASSKISAEIRSEVKKDQFLSELKSSVTYDKQFESIKDEFVKEIKKASSKKSSQ